MWSGHGHPHREAFLLCEAADAFSHQQQNESGNDVFQGNHEAEKVRLLKNVNLFQTLGIQ